MTIFLFMFPMCLRADILYQENFEGDDSGYELIGAGFVGEGDGWEPALWGLNTDMERIGITQAAPAKRAAILWDAGAFADDFTQDAIDTFVSLSKWAVENKENPKAAFFPGFEFSEGSSVVAEALQEAGFEVDEVIDALDLPEPDELDLLIHSNEQASTLFSGYGVPLISYSASDHDDTAIAGIGVALDFLDPVVLEVPDDAKGHPALGGKEGTIPWTEAGIPLQGIGKLHSGGKALAFTEDPNTGDPTAAIFVIEEGDPLLGAFNPEPEGDRYIVGAATNKFDVPEKELILNPIDVSGQSDLKLAVLLAATAADFETSDFFRIEADPDSGGPREPEIIAEFFGDGDEFSECFKGLTDGDDCLPQDAFGEFIYDLPNGSTDLELRFIYLSSWGNEILGIDNIRVFTGQLGDPCDFDGSGALDVADVDLLSAGIRGGGGDSKFDVNGDGSVSDADLNFFITNESKLHTWIGDANLDGEFNSSDFVSVFQAGKFETGQAAGWGEGDWNGDGVFSSSDFVVAFQDGGFEIGPRWQEPAGVPEPSSFVLLALGAFGILSRVRRK